MKTQKKTESPESTESTESKNDKPQKEVIASRKSCDARGTGLSHYILADQTSRPKR